MTRIKKLANMIEDELCSAQEYAERSVDAKIDESTAWANRFKEMATDELKHATYLHELAVSDIEELSKSITPPQKMLDKWEKCHKEYIEKTAWIKQMLTL